MGKSNNDDVIEFSLGGMIMMIIVILGFISILFFLGRGVFVQKDSQATPFQHCAKIVDKNYRVVNTEFGSRLKKFLYFETEELRCKIKVNNTEYSKYKVGEEYILKGNKTTDKCWVEDILNSCIETQFPKSQ
jgi:hypothetical protein